MMLVFVATILLCLCSQCTAFASSNDGRSSPPILEQPDDDVVSRRALLWKAPLGAVGLYAYGRLAYNALSVRGIEYPIAHEERVASTITKAAVAAAAASTTTTTRTLRVLEVGIGSDARLIRRGLYDDSIHQLSGIIDRLEMTGLDLQPPTDGKILNDATSKLKRVGSQEGMEIDFTTIKSSITQKTPFSDGYFDSIICCLTLCSVDDQTAALQEIKRLLRPAGGTFGYLEHVAVEGEEHKFLEFQQTLLDPLQQLVADNCHLHRYTEQTMASVFQSDQGKSRFLQKERFYVNSMWPVSCQCCGALQLV
jgi:ubiquinone/menaquinone biosynthesis C-methylase UbiE